MRFYEELALATYIHKLTSRYGWFEYMGGVSGAYAVLAGFDRAWVQMSVLIVVWIVLMGFSTRAQQTIERCVKDISYRTDVNTSDIVK